jgi:hypothetical protein
VLQSITLQPPLLVVEVLPPTGIVGANRLYMPSRYGANPDFLPGRRYDEQLATLTFFRGEAAASLIEVNESLASAPPRPSWIAR